MEAGKWIEKGENGKKTRLLFAPRGNNNNKKMCNQGLLRLNDLHRVWECPRRVLELGQEPPGPPEQPCPHRAGCPVPCPTITASHGGSPAAPRQCWKLPGAGSISP